MAKVPLAPVLALAGAVLAAVLLGYLAHDILGYPSLAIGVDALAAAVLVGLAWAEMAS
jgi:hypothetical protein